MMKPQSIDHIFVNEGLFEKISSATNRVLFKDSIKLSTGDVVNLSDHYGVVASVQF
jgi:hypothetical protein